MPPMPCFGPTSKLPKHNTLLLPKTRILRVKVHTLTTVKSSQDPKWKKILTNTRVLSSQLN